MVGLRRSFWPMIGGYGRGSRPRGAVIPEWLTNYPANSSKETLRSMTSPVPPRDWTDIHWPDIAGSRGRALDRGAAAGGHRAAWPAFAARNRCPDRRGLSGAGARNVACRRIPVTFLPLQPVGISTEHIDFPGTQTLPTDVALKAWMAIGESVARAGVRKLVMVTSHGGNSAAMSLVAQDLRAHHGLLVVTTSWSRFGAPDGLFSAEELRHGIHGGAVETSIMLARYPHTVRKEAIADFHPASIAMEKKFRWLSDASARAFRVAGAGSARKRRRRRRDQGLRGERRKTARSRRARVLRIARRRR